ncbi:glycosyltransferase family 4 protein [Mycobacterium numidiamassiliense]|uniref:glycosyltransferase family 4 protein n=1 Tax=Mycobacterium numidiamassiliense TaxID=1841861 RepID=UPI00097DBDA2|nr:glycosyltransferase family 1 protein [Mycobacterium numidiamassiliense]
MKVAFDHQIFSFQRYGGVSRYFFELANRLPAYGASEVSVVAPLYVNKYLTQDSARFATRGKHVPYTFGGLPVVSAVNRLLAPLAWRGANPDIVHETYYAAKPVGRGRRRVVTVYDMIHELFSAEFPDAAQVTAAKRAAVDRADHVICISENTQRDLVRIYGIAAKRTSVVHLGHSITTETNRPTEECGKLRPSLLYVGNRRGYKNFSTLLKAYASSPTLREFELTAFGGHPLLPDEQKEICALGIADRVRYESGSDQELAERYRAAAAFVCPSMYEGFGLPPLEAMNYGCPVVCSNGGSIPEVVGDAGVYFDPKSPEDLRTTLERVVTTPELRSDLRERGYARIGTFSWDKCAEETARIYREIL